MLDIENLEQLFHKVVNSDDLFEFGNALIVIKGIVFINCSKRLRSFS